MTKRAPEWVRTSNPVLGSAVPAQVVHAKISSKENVFSDWMCYKRPLYCRECEMFSDWTGYKRQLNFSELDTEHGDAPGM